MAVNVIWQPSLTFMQLNATQGFSTDSIDQDQTAQNVQSDLLSILSDQKGFFFSEKLNFKITFSCFFLLVFHFSYLAG